MLLRSKAVEGRFSHLANTLSFLFTFVFFQSHTWRSKDPRRQLGHFQSAQDFQHRCSWFWSMRDFLCSCCRFGKSCGPMGSTFTLRKSLMKMQRTGWSTTKSGYGVVSPINILADITEYILLSLKHKIKSCRFFFFLQFTTVFQSWFFLGHK